MEASSVHRQVISMHHSLEEVLSCTKPPLQPQQQQQPPPPPQQQQQQEKKARPHPEHSLRCPRCDSPNTKFCYYNNYSLSQPRYFCKGCRRYWTQGGSLRNVPVGGGCRKNKRSSSSKSRPCSLDHHHSHHATLSTTTNPLLIPPLPLPPPLPYDPNDPTTLSVGGYHPKPVLGDQHQHGHNPNPIPILGASPPAFLDILRGGFSDAIRGGFHYMYNGGVEEGIAVQVGGAVGATAAVGAAAVVEEQEYYCCKGVDGDGKMTMGCMQWQVAGDRGNMGMDPVRDYSCGGGVGVAPSWHGLVNSSLL